MPSGWINFNMPPIVQFQFIDFLAAFSLFSSKRDSYEDQYVSYGFFQTGETTAAAAVFV